MSEQIRQPKTGTSGSPSSNIESTKTSVGDSGELTDDLDNILDQIDEVLEANAEEFVKNYVQKGGE
ncbi:MAG: Pup-like protein [Actinomycetota bacterium]|jgi:ubiquitin-like protein Pup